MASLETPKNYWQNRNIDISTFRYCRYFLVIPKCIGHWYLIQPQYNLLPNTTKYYDISNLPKKISISLFLGEYYRFFHRLTLCASLVIIGVSKSTASLIVRDVSVAIVWPCHSIFQDIILGRKFAPRLVCRSRMVLTLQP